MRQLPGRRRASTVELAVCRLLPAGSSLTAPGRSSPAMIALSTTSERRPASSLRCSALMWLPTVLGERCRCSAISAVVRWVGRSSSTRSSAVEIGSTDERARSRASSASARRSSPGAGAHRRRPAWAASSWSLAARTSPRSMKASARHRLTLGRDPGAEAGVQGLQHVHEVGDRVVVSLARHEPVAREPRRRVRQVVSGLVGSGPSHGLLGVLAGLLPPAVVGGEQRQAAERGEVGSSGQPLGGEDRLLERLHGALVVAAEPRPGSHQRQGDGVPGTAPGLLEARRRTGRPPSSGGVREAPASRGPAPPWWRRTGRRAGARCRAPTVRARRSRSRAASLSPVMARSHEAASLRSNCARI